MYTSMCLRDFKDFKTGKIFDTYEQSNYVFVREEEGNDEKFVQLYSTDHRKYFRSVGRSIDIPKLIKKERFRFFRKIQYAEEEREWYGFDLETKYLRRIQREIYLPIYLIREEEFILQHADNLFSKEFILQHSDTIDYVLSSLEEIAKMHTFTNVDLDSEITRAAEYFNELWLLFNSVDKSAQIEVTNLLGAHRDHMNRIIRVMKEFNRN
ncbi:hypothetical protein [Bacillus sp. K2I17]|uniref:hypothetical protein n=1 Tax=Bacillus sp. K2I17 TaxID=2014743 RepID=UPI000B51B743|nr:hypothetical protein [Bacillus sp. K2I17]OWT48558.1 hypothetical protein CER22_24925 [Bacillus sp. K2I17]